MYQDMRSMDFLRKILCSRFYVGKKTIRLITMIKSIFCINDNGGGAYVKWENSCTRHYRKYSSL